MPDRKCGGCTLCCRLLPVRELHKPSNTRCEHQGRKGCAIYHRLGFPASCAIWSCRWLTEDDTADMVRPDRAGYVLDVMPDIVRARDDASGRIEQIEVVQVWVSPGGDPLADRALRRYGERLARRGVALLLRFGSDRATAVFAPPFSADHKWHVVPAEQMERAETRTGSLLLDQLMEERAHA
jgi:hypothetical protein